MEELYLENGEKASMDDVIRWWQHHYPKDIFINGPLPTIWDAMDDLLNRRVTY